MTEREPSIYCDFADIRSRMLGDDKPRPKKSGTWVAEWSNPEVFEISPGLVSPIIGIDPARPGSDQTVFHMLTDWSIRKEIVPIEIDKRAEEDAAFMREMSERMTRAIEESIYGGRKPQPAAEPPKPKPPCLCGRTAIMHRPNCFYAMAMS